MLALALAVGDLVAHAVVVERDLGDEDDVGAAREPRGAGDPAGVAAHHLQHHHAIVALGRRVQAIERVGRAGHRGVEAEGRQRRGEIVVDRLGDADDGDASFEELLRDRERAVPADADERTQAEALDRRSGFFEQLAGQLPVSPCPVLAENRPRFAVPSTVPPRYSSAPISR